METLRTIWDQLPKTKDNYVSLSELQSIYLAIGGDKRDVKEAKANEKSVSETVHYANGVGTKPADNI